MLPLLCLVILIVVATTVLDAYQTKYAQRWRRTIMKTDTATGTAARPRSVDDLG
jgi:hypothetical protein